MNRNAVARSTAMKKMLALMALAAFASGYSPAPEPTADPAHVEIMLASLAQLERDGNPPRQAGTPAPTVR